MRPPWLIAVLETLESRALDSAEDRAAVADAIVEAFPREAMLDLIRESIQGIENRVTKDTGHRASVGELARNAAQGAIAALETT